MFHYDDVKEDEDIYIDVILIGGSNYLASYVLSENPKVFLMPPKKIEVIEEELKQEDVKLDIIDEDAANMDCDQEPKPACVDLIAVKPQPILTDERVSLIEALQRHRAGCLESIRDVQVEHAT